VSKDEALKAVKTITKEISESSLEAEALEAVRTLILWAGDDPEREGLVDTPKRVVKAYKEFFSGYEEDPEEILSRTFEEVEGYDDAVIVRNIRVESHCEHHMVPIVGVAHIGYIPKNRVVGISKLARLVDLFGKRLQTQETRTARNADTNDKMLQPKGVAVVIEASHMCMMMRGVQKQNSLTTTSGFRGTFEKMETRNEFLKLIDSKLS